MNIVALLEYELIYFEATVQHITHYSVETSLEILAPVALSLEQRIHKLLLLQWGKTAFSQKSVSSVWYTQW